MDAAILKDLCRCLAYHCVESENMVSLMTPVDKELVNQIETARRLIAEAGFEFDALYPVGDRPIVSSTIISPGAVETAH